MAAEPGQRRPAARRRPARGLAAPRPRRHGRDVPSLRLRRRRRRGRDPRCAPARLARRAPGVRAVTRPQLAKLALAALLGVAAAVLVACGGSGNGLIPAAQAGPLQGDIEAVEKAAEEGNGNCSATEAALLRTDQHFANLPSSLDS